MSTLPLPLKVNIRDKDGSVYLSGGDINARYISFDVACDEDEAAQIVRACNNHEALVTALQKVADHDGTEPVYGSKDEWSEAAAFHSCQEIARAVLANLEP